MPARTAITKRKAKLALEAQAPLKGLKVVKVGMAIGLTLNMGNYESLRLDCSMGAEISDGDNIDRARAHLAVLCTEQLQRDYDSGDWPIIDRR